MRNYRPIIDESTVSTVIIPDRQVFTVRSSKRPRRLDSRLLQTMRFEVTAAGQVASRPSCAKGRNLAEHLFAHLSQQAEGYRRSHSSGADDTNLVGAASLCRSGGSYAGYEGLHSSRYHIP